MNTAEEKHFTPQEVAERWQLSPDTVRRLFRDEPGVIHLALPRLLKRKKDRTSLRIPASVLARVHEQWTRRPGSEVKPRRGGV